MSDDIAIQSRISRIRMLTADEQGSDEFFEAASLAQSVIHDTIGGSHPIMAELTSALQASEYGRARAAARGVVALFDEGALKSPRLAIAHEIEGEVLDLAQAQAESAERAKEAQHRQIHLSIAAFLAGAVLEDAMRRLCDARGLQYDVQRTSVSKLQAVLYQPSKQIEVISQSENKQITTWGDTRNKADHGKFDEITQTEVVAMILGVRSLLEKHLP